MDAASEVHFRSKVCNTITPWLSPQRNIRIQKRDKDRIEANMQAQSDHLFVPPTFLFSSSLHLPYMSQSSWSLLSLTVPLANCRITPLHAYVGFCVCLCLCFQLRTGTTLMHWDILCRNTCSNGYVRNSITLAPLNGSVKRYAAFLRDTASEARWQTVHSLTYSLLAGRPVEKEGAASQATTAAKHCASTTKPAQRCLTST